MNNSKSFSLIEEAKDWICVWKNANTLSVPSRQRIKDARLCVGLELQNLLQQQIYPVHRIDFEVSGLLLFAKTPLAQRHLNKAFEDQQVTKSYRALRLSQEQALPAPLVEGAEKYFSENSIGDQKEWRCLLAEGKRRSFPAAHGKEALSRGRRLRTLSQAEATALLYAPENAPENLELWEMEPITGRRHQLRLHACLAKSPILGDILYGGKAWKQEGIALCAYKLDFSRMPNRDLIKIPDQLVFDFSTNSRKQMSWASL
jgi:tRNA pseudouridine32 synthase/23S rRNA pseudouridine746 synthase